jgi:acyl-coenzyme A thioesterase PaaI-like protein
MNLNPFELIERVRDYSPGAANTLLNHLIPRIIPLADGLKVRVREVTDRRSVLTMPLRRRTKNHVGSIYFGAQMTLADLAAGVLVFSKFPPGPYGALINRVEADFLAKAKGSLRCVCELPDDTYDTLESVRTSSEGKAEAWLPVELFDPEGKVVTRVRVLGAIRRF